MKQYCYIWLIADKLTTCYHQKGGFVTFANSLDEARENVKTSIVANSYDSVNPKIEDSDIFETEPSYIIDLSKAEGSFIFQDTGCC